MILATRVDVHVLAVVVVSTLATGIPWWGRVGAFVYCFLMLCLQAYAEHRAEKAQKDQDEQGA